MNVIRVDVTREEVIKFYVAYDCRKKTDTQPSDLLDWHWHDPKALDAKLAQHNLKKGVVAAYRLWWFIELSAADLLDSAIVGHVFDGQPQALSLLLARGVIDEWVPQGQPEWLDHLKRGKLFPRDWAMILRPSTVTERPAKWYLEDGTRPGVVPSSTYAAAQ